MKETLAEIMAPSEQTDYLVELRARLTNTSPAGMEYAIPQMVCTVTLLRTTTILHEALGHKLQQYGVSLAQYNLLVVLYSAPDRKLPMHAIGERMCVTKTNITKLVDGLERSGMVFRQPCPQDRRKVFASLSELGIELVKKVLPEQWMNAHYLMSSLKQDEVATLSYVLARLGNAITEKCMNTDTHRTDDLLNKCLEKRF